MVFWIKVYLQVCKRGRTASTVLPHLLPGSAVLGGVSQYPQHSQAFQRLARRDQGMPGVTRDQQPPSLALPCRQGRELRGLAVGRPAMALASLQDKPVAPHSSVGDTCCDRKGEAVGGVCLREYRCWCIIWTSPQFFTYKQAEATFAKWQTS